MKIITTLFLTLPLLSFSQKQVPSIEDRTHYIMETDVKVLPYNFAEHKLDSTKFLLAKAGLKFDLFSTLEDTSGNIKYYIVKFWEFENQVGAIDKTIMKIEGEIENTSDKKPKKKEKLNNKKTSLKLKKDSLSSNKNIGFSSNGNFYSIPARFFKEPQVVKLDKRKSVEGSTTTLSFVGAGDVQKSLNEGTAAAANTGLGVLFNQQWYDPNKLIQGFELEFTINVASTADTINAAYATDGTVSNSRDFGTYILLPMNSGQATRFKFYSYFSPNKIGFLKNSLTRKPFYLSNVISGFSGEFVASNRVWNAKPNALNATGMMVKFGIFHEFVPNSIRLEKNYSIKIGFSGSFRGIYGDAGFNNTQTEDFRMNLIGTTTRQFYGFEFDLSIRIRNIEARVSLPMLKGPGNSVPGLSDTQFVTSITFVGGFPIAIGEKSK